MTSLLKHTVNLIIIINGKVKLCKMYLHLADLSLHEIKSSSFVSLSEEHQPSSNLLPQLLLVESLLVCWSLRPEQLGQGAGIQKGDVVTITDLC